MIASIGRICLHVGVVTAALAISTVVRAGPAGPAIEPVGAPGRTLAQDGYRVYLPAAVRRPRTPSSCRRSAAVAYNPDWISTMRQPSSR